MPNYRRIMCAIDQSRSRDDVLRRAAKFSRNVDAQLALASVVDFHAGFESGHYPFLTPNQLQKQTVKLVTEQLAEMVETQGIGPMEILVGAGEPRRTLVDMAISWRADLVIVGASATLGLLENNALPWNEQEPLPFDVLAFETRENLIRRSGRMIRALVPSF